MNPILRTCCVLLLAALECQVASADTVMVSSTSAKILADGQVNAEKSPFVQGHSYLAVTASDVAASPRVRIPAPEGTYYVYLAWAVHPQAGRHVIVRAGDQQNVIDGRQLACGAEPEEFLHDDMDEFKGICSSGLYRATSEPLEFRSGDFLEMEASPEDMGRILTFDYAIFSTDLLLDDLGNDAHVPPQLVLNLRDYSPQTAGLPHGLAIGPAETELPNGCVEWSVPRAGRYLLSAMPFNGPNRSPRQILEVLLPSGDRTPLALPCKSPQFGRADWVDLAILDVPKGTRLIAKSEKGLVTSLDLLRLKPLNDMNESEQLGSETEFILQWEKPSPGKPWLREVEARSIAGVDLKVEKLNSVTEADDLPHGLRVRFHRKLPTIGQQGTVDSNSLTIGSEAVAISLADGYGFTLSRQLLESQPCIWMKDLGIFASRHGTFAEQRQAMDQQQAKVAETAHKPFRSPSEDYWQWLGANEWDHGTSDKAFEFAYHVKRPLSQRVETAIASMPEVDYDYFCQRMPDRRFHRMFLGWPNVSQEFAVLCNGRIEVSPRSSLGTGHPAAEPLAVEFGIGDSPQFPEDGDLNVQQSLEDGYHLAVQTDWKHSDTAAKTIAVAYPLDGEEVKTGGESLAAFIRFSRVSGDAPQWLRVSELPGSPPLEVRGNLVWSGNRIVLGVSGADLAIESQGEQGVVFKLLAKGLSADVVIPFVGVEQSLVQRALQQGFDATLKSAKHYWDERLAHGAQFDVPDPEVALQYKTFYPRLMITGDLDSRGVYALKTSPQEYEEVWLHCTSYGIEALCRRGHFEEARQYLEAGFAWQGSQPVSEAPQYSTWKGFFNAPPWYTRFLWVNFHGWFQWASARYYLFSDDRDWLDQKLPALIESLEWTDSQRQLTKVENADGSRPANYGWLPAGRVTDSSVGTSAFSDCINWMGFNELVRALERIDHPQAAEFRAKSDDYRACILRGLRMSTSMRDPVLLADGTFVPYVPGYLESQGHEDDMWYPGVVDAALVGILDSGILAVDDPMEDWICSNLQDNLLLLAPNLADEGHFLGQACAYLRRDEPKLAIYTFYSCLATQMARETRTTFEHRSWGAKTIYELAPWAMGYWTRLLSGMVCYDEGDTLAIGRAMPAAWLEPGQDVNIERLQTRFGPMSINLHCTQDHITGVLTLPTRYAPASATLRLRVRGTVKAVRLNGRPAVFDSTTETVPLPLGGRVEVDAIVDRNS